MTQDEDETSQAHFDAHGTEAAHDSCPTIEQSHRQTIELVQLPTWSNASATIPYNELPDLPADSVLGTEWNAFRRELPRLLSAGLAGRFALVKATAIVGVYATFGEALSAGSERFQLQPFLVQPIRAVEPLLRTRGHTLPCPPSNTRSLKMK